MKSKILFTVLLTLVGNILSAQDFLKLSAEIYKSYNELNGAYENFDKVQNIVKEIEKGNKPNVASYGSDWSGLANSYKKAAEILKNSKLVTEFDASPYSISITDLNNCYIKDQNFKKLKDYKTQLDTAVARGQRELPNIADYKKLIEQSFSALSYLIEVNKKLASVPIYNEIFQWNWLELDQGVHPALGELSSAINAHEKKLKQEIDKVKTQSSNLAANISQLENAICLVSGTYTGTCSSANLPCATKLVIVKNGNSYSGSITYSYKTRSKTWSFSEISPVDNKPSVAVANNRNLTITAVNGDEFLIFSGTFSQDYRTLLNFMDSHDKKPCSLTK